MSKLIKINYDALQAGDMVHCAGRSPFAMITRIVTSGWKNRLNHDISVHTGIIIDVYGQKLLAEMQAGGLEINSLERYTKVGGRRWVIDITRDEEIFNIDDNKLKVQKEIALDRRRTIEYDYKGLLEFVFKKVNDDGSKNYCSEYVYFLTRIIGSDYPDNFKTKVSPKDLQEFCSKNHKSINWRI